MEVGKSVIDYIDDNCDNGACNYTYIKICDTAVLKNREYCLHQPPLEMALKIVGMYTLNSYFHTELYQF